MPGEILIDAVYSREENHTRYLEGIWLIATTNINRIFKTIKNFDGNKLLT